MHGQSLAFWRVSLGTPSSLVFSRIRTSVSGGGNLTKLRVPEIDFCGGCGLCQRGDWRGRRRLRLPNRLQHSARAATQSHHALMPPNAAPRPNPMYAHPLHAHVGVASASSPLQTSVRVFNHYR